MHVFNGHTDRVTSVTFLHHAQQDPVRLLASASYDKCIRLWNGLCSNLSVSNACVFCMCELERQSLRLRVRCSAHSRMRKMTQAAHMQQWRQALLQVTPCAVTPAKSKPYAPPILFEKTRLLSEEMVEIEGAQ